MVSQNSNSVYSNTLVTIMQIELISMYSIVGVFSAFQLFIVSCNYMHVQSQLRRSSVAQRRSEKRRGPSMLFLVAIICTCTARVIVNAFFRRSALGESSLESFAIYTLPTIFFMAAFQFYLLTIVQVIFKVCLPVNKHRHLFWIKLFVFLSLLVLVLLLVVVYSLVAEGKLTANGFESQAWYAFDGVMVILLGGTTGMFVTFGRIMWLYLGTTLTGPQLQKRVVKVFRAGILLSICFGIRTICNIIFISDGKNFVHTLGKFLPLWNMFYYPIVEIIPMAIGVVLVGDKGLKRSPSISNKASKQTLAQRRPPELATPLVESKSIVISSQEDTSA